LGVKPACVNRFVKNTEQTVNRIFLAMTEDLGYDVQLK
jgi:hypothetical protein